jgi:hypothetical protein
MEEEVRRRYQEQYRKELEAKKTLADELYEYEKAGRLSEKDYQYNRGIYDARQNIRPLTMGDRLMPEVFWRGSFMQPAAVEDLPDWMFSKEYLASRQAARKAGTDTDRVGPAVGAPGDEVRATYGWRMGVDGIDQNAIGWNGYEKYDPRTQKWYTAAVKKDRRTGERTYEFTQAARLTIMETIRRDTIARIGPEKYKQLMEHARQRSPEYRAEQKMREVRAQAEKWKKQQEELRQKARAQQQAKAAPQLQAGGQTSPRQSERDRQKEMAKKAEAQQQREAAGQAEPKPDASVPVIPEDCVIDLVGWMPHRPDLKFHAIIWISGGKAAYALQSRSPAEQKNEVHFSERTCTTVFRGTLKDNQISGVGRQNCTPLTTSWTNSSGSCSRITVWRCTSRGSLTFHRDGSFNGVSRDSCLNEWTTSRAICGQSGSNSSSPNAPPTRTKGTWRIRRGGGAGGRSWSDEVGSHRIYNPDAVASDK